MGGFAGGDEAGYWDDDTIFTLSDKKDKYTSKPSIEKSDLGYSIKAYAKSNKELYDTISFVPCKCDAFIIEECEAVTLESNSIYKAYKALIEYTADTDIEEFFYEHKVVVTKDIPYSLGHGGASSDAAAFMCLTKEVCNLVISTDELVKIGATIGDNVAFFILNVVD